MGYILSASGWIPQIRTLSDVTPKYLKAFVDIHCRPMVDTKCMYVYWKSAMPSNSDIVLEGLISEGSHAMFVEINLTHARQKLVRTYVFVRCTVRAED